MATAAALALPGSLGWAQKTAQARSSRIRLTGLRAPIDIVEDELGVDEIVARGHAKDVVRRIEHLLYVSEYKRRQAAPGAKIGARNFGRDRRYPITNGFRDALTR